MQWRAVVPAGAFIAYIISYFLLYPYVGVGAGVPSLVPVIVTAWYFKVRGGVIGAILAVCLNMLLGKLAGQGWLTLLQTGGWLGPLVMLLTGLIVGRLRDLSLSLSESEARYRAVVENQTEFIVRWRPDGIRTFTNEAYRRYFGLTPEQAHSTDFMSLVAEEDRGAVAEKISRLCSGKAPSEISITRMIKPDGSIAWQEWVDQAIYDDEGQIFEFLSVGRDISKRMQAEESLQRANEQMAATLDALPDLIFEVDSDSRIFNYHAPHPELLYLPPAEFMGKPMTELLPDEAAGVIRRAIDEAAATGHHQGGEYTLQTAAGRRYFSLSIAAKRESGTPTGRFILLARDVTESKQAEEALRQSQKMESLGVLAGGIAHDFNNLLTGILGHISLACRRLPPDSPARESLETAAHTAQRAAVLTQQLLAYAGKGQVEIAPLDLNKLILENTILLESAVPKTITLDVQLADDLPLIKVDGGQIQQVIMNLIINAAEIYEGRQGRVEIRTWAEHTSSPQAENDAQGLSLSHSVFFSVKDQGKGMDDETLSHVFDPFFTTKTTGRGLGLSAVAGIIRQHGGKIRISSKPGKGTTFTVCLPATQELPKSEVPASSPSLSGSGTVLVVDDESVIRSLVTEFLRSHNYTVLAAENGKAGLAAYRKYSGNIDLVLLDLTMPVMSGRETLAKLRQIRPDLPVLLMTGFGEAEVIQQLARDDKVTFLQKPFELDRLLEAIHTLQTEGAGC